MKSVNKGFLGLFKSGKQASLSWAKTEAYSSIIVFTVRFCSGLMLFKRFLF